MQCHQRTIRDEEARKDPRAVLPNLDGAFVQRITSKQAKPIILRYEWLGTMGRTKLCYGLFTNDKSLIGVALFGWPGGVQSRDICGKEYRGQAICLERGACVHWAPKNAPSFLIRHATRAAYRDSKEARLKVLRPYLKAAWEKDKAKLSSSVWPYHKPELELPDDLELPPVWRIFYAYADEEAGEIGFVYQVCGWYYIGQGVGRTPGRPREYFLPPGKDPNVRKNWLTSRALRHKEERKSKLKIKDESTGGKIDDPIKDYWRVKTGPAKHKYVCFEGGSVEKKELENLCRYPLKDHHGYPKKE